MNNKYYQMLKNKQVISLKDVDIKSTTFEDRIWLILAVYNQLIEVKKYTRAIVFEDTFISLFRVNKYLRYIKEKYPDLYKQEFDNYSVELDPLTSELFKPYKLTYNLEKLHYLYVSIVAVIGSALFLILYFLSSLETLSTILISVGGVTILLLLTRFIESRIIKALTSPHRFLRVSDKEKDLLEPDLQLCLDIYTKPEFSITLQEFENVFTEEYKELIF